MWYREALVKHIYIITLSKFHCWLKLNNQIGISTTDTYLCAIYIPPAESTYHDEEYRNNNHTEISRLVLLCGDFNARTGFDPDNIDPKGNEHDFGQNPLSLTKKTSTKKQS